MGERMRTASTRGNAGMDPGQHETQNIRTRTSEKPSAGGKFYEPGADSNTNGGSVQSHSYIEVARGVALS